MLHWLQDSPASSLACNTGYFAFRVSKFRISFLEPCKCQHVALSQLVSQCCRLSIFDGMLPTEAVTSGPFPLPLLGPRASRRTCAHWLILFLKIHFFCANKLGVPHSALAMFTNPMLAVWKLRQHALRQEKENKIASINAYIIQGVRNAVELCLVKCQYLCGNAILLAILGSTAN